VSAKELAYYRAHFREAVQKDGVICLECGAIFKYLPGHLCKHSLSSHEYRAKWGYNRTTPLERLATRRKKRRNALRMKFGSLPHPMPMRKPSTHAGVMGSPTVQKGD
jgi:predicted transcriptional regulator